MKPESILKTDFLDILFQNRNKDYGAYELRKQYVYRVKKSMGIMLLLVGVFAALQSWKIPKKHISVELLEGPVLTLDDYKKPDEIKKEIEKHDATAHQKKYAQEIVTPPIITIDPIIDKPVVDVRDLNNANIGLTKIKGDSIDGFHQIPSVNSNPGNGKANDKNDEIVDTNIPIDNPSVMPEFAGGTEAMRNFLLRNLRQPDDIEEGQKVSVIVRFVVSKTGNIEDIEIDQSGREDLDEEVVRVIKRMPAWKPGLQNGYPIAVYFRLPITFANNN